MKKAILLAFSGVFAFLTVSDVDAGKVRITKKDCRKLVRHMAAPDVDYQPGVDAHGRPVVPADLGGGSPIKVPDEITFNIGKDLAKEFNPKYAGEAVFGKVTVKKDGRVFWNGQPIGDQSQNAIAEACRKAYGNRP